MISPYSVNGPTLLKRHFKNVGIRAQVAYASKAFSSVAIYEVAKQQGLSLDVVSGGELHTAVVAGFPRERIHFHGNNKSFTELQYAFDEKIGCIVIDNFSEIALVKEIAESRKEQMNVLIRVTPGVEALHTIILRRGKKIRNSVLI